jgi:hypothetical protein
MTVDVQKLRTYRDLLVAYEPKVIANQEEADAANAIIDELTDLPELNEDQREFIFHSSICDPDSSEGELKLYGRAIRVPDEVRRSYLEGWWTSGPPDAATVFSLDIDEAAFISWESEHGEMIIRRWSPGSGEAVEKRSYP